MKAFFGTSGKFMALFAATDIIFIFTVWLIRPEAMKSVSLFIILFSFLIIAVGCFLQHIYGKRVKEAAMKLIYDPCEENKKALLELSGTLQRELIGAAYESFMKKSEALAEKQLALKNYREYIEAWTHEIKTPLSLLTLVIENHPDEMSEYAADRLDYVRLQINHDVERILYYARLQAEHPDLNFTRFRLDLCAEETISDYTPLAEERGIEITTEMKPLEVSADRRVLSFMLSQLVSNAIKYAAAEGGKAAVIIRYAESGEAETALRVGADADSAKRICLSVRNNGGGVAPEELPFIFDKGFTGDHPRRQSATGMGLYLVSKYAEELNIDVRPEQLFEGEFTFGVELSFPDVSYIGNADGENNSFKTAK